MVRNLWFELVQVLLFISLSNALESAGSQGGLPASAGELPASAGELPASAGELPASAGELPASAGELPASAGDLPASAGDLPASAGVLPASAGELPVSAGELPASAGELPASSGKLPVSAALAAWLAAAVCADIQDFVFTDQASADACPANFYNAERGGGEDAGPRGSARVRCRWAGAALALELAPSRWWQVVVLLPHAPGHSSDYGAISYSVVQPHRTLCRLAVPSPRLEYSVYSSALAGGHAARWRRHPPLPSWTRSRLSLPAREDYALQIRFLNSSDTEAGDEVTAIISWNHTGDADVCFTFMNYCEDLMLVDVGPDKEARVEVPGLPRNHSCRVEVTGLYGTTALEYRTPAPRPHVHDESKEDSLQVPEQVCIEAWGGGGGAWDVRVAWAAPRRAPDRYTLVLTADAEHTLNVTGKATEAVFRGVRGRGTYNVSLTAHRGGARAHAFRRAVFVESSGVWRWVGAAGGAWAAAALGAGALCWLRLRLRPHAGEALEDQEDKPLEEELVRESGDKWEIRSERLELREVIGEGAFGKVRRAVLAPQGREVAVKMLRDFPTADEVRAFRLEIEVMKSVGAHGNVVSLLGCCSGRRPLLVQEYCARGDLLTFLRCSWDLMVSKRNGRYYNSSGAEREYGNEPARKRLVVNQAYEPRAAELTARDLLSFCRQIARGMEFLAANRLVHRDLAARNVLVTADRTLKIADFGLTRDIYEENQYKQKGNQKMPIKWMAPESLERRIFTSQSDVWSFGVVVWEVVTVGGAPYAAVPPARLLPLLRAGYRMPRPDNCSPQLYEVMCRCWRAQPRARPSFSELLRRLDELLARACAADYLSLELQPAPPPRLPALHYLKMVIKGRGAWSRREPYERPLKAPPPSRNHYSCPPDAPPPGRNHYSCPPDAPPPGRNHYSCPPDAPPPGRNLYSCPPDAPPPGRNHYSCPPDAPPPGRNHYSCPPDAPPPGRNHYSCPPDAPPPGRNHYSCPPDAPPPGRNHYSCPPDAPPPGRNHYSCPPDAPPPGRNHYSCPPDSSAKPPA